jgi:hypothetical protein
MGSHGRWCPVPIHRATVAALASDNVWAVGQNYGAADGPETLVEHWDGGQWSIVASPNPSGRTAYLTAVAAVSSSDIWAVGYSGSPSEPAAIPIAEHFDGNSWTLVLVPYVQSSNFNWFNAITVIASDDIWAVGYENYDGKHENGQTGLIEHWDGTVWNLIKTPLAGPSETQFWAVAAKSSNDVWAFGSTWNQKLDMVPLIEHWTGKAWKKVASPDPGKAAEFFGATTINGQMWAVGDYGIQAAGWVDDPLTLVITH